LEDSNDIVRAATARSLGDVGPAAKGAVPALRAMPEDRDERVREAARAALEKNDR
jgi:HEAT repeat protein